MHHFSATKIVRTNFSNTSVEIRILQTCEDMHIIHSVAFQDKQNFGHIPCPTSISHTRGHFLARSRQNTRRRFIGEIMGVVRSGAGSTRPKSESMFPRSRLHNPPFFDDETGIRALTRWNPIKRSDLSPDLV